MEPNSRYQSYLTVVLRSSIPVKFRVTVTDTPVSEILYRGCANWTVAAVGKKEII
jgi:hypothetical protein